ncbi:hypothetical protein BaRGS_00036098 [Batillaria attramentaria]|uniref:SOCS box domain-containing protein n=1 Tax=Batillaria attramentaria TaxID=370345 RepID=A0ABD0JCV2_9CAEN
MESDDLPSAIERRKECLLAKALDDSNWDVVTDIVRGGVGAERREHVLHEAVKACQWECTTQLVLQGVSLQHRDMVFPAAVRHCQWSCVLLLAKLGISLETRDAAFQDAVQNQRWESVKELAKLRITQQLRVSAIYEAVRHECFDCVSELVKYNVQQKGTAALFEVVIHNQKHYIPKLAQHGFIPEQMDRVLAEALKRSHWGCVAELMKLDISSEQRDVCFVKATESNMWSIVSELARLGIRPADANTLENLLQKALKYRQWDCLVALVSSGVTREWTQAILTEAVRQNQWNHVPELVRICSDRNQTDQVLRGAVRCRQWNCVKEVYKVGFSQEHREHICYEAVCRGQWKFALAVLKSNFTPSERILEATILHGGYTRFLNSLIWWARGGVRVFKQLCQKQLKNGVALNVYNYICQHDAELAFHVAVTHSLWDLVLLHFEDIGLSKRSRRLALQRAVRQGDWQHVVQMACKSVTTQCDRRLAFLAAVRQGAWRWALEFCHDENGDLTVSKSDVRFAVKICVSLGQWEGALELCTRCDAGIFSDRLVKRLLLGSIQANELNCFLKLFDLFEIVDQADLRMVRLLFRKASLLKKNEFVLKVCSSDFEYMYMDVNEIALETAIQTGNWDLLKEITEDCYCGSFRAVFEVCSRKIGRRRKGWLMCIPSLEHYCTNVDSWDDDFVLPEMEDGESNTLGPSLVLKLAKWCRVHCHWNLAFIFSFMSGSSSVVQSLLKKHSSHIREDFLRDGFHIAVRKGDVKKAAAFLAHLEEDEMYSDFLSTLELRPLIVKCRKMGLTNWAVFFAILKNEWNIVDKTLVSCSDQNLLRRTTEEASQEDQWRLVIKLLGRCSEGPDDSLNADILRTAISHGEVDCTLELLQITNPCRVSACDFYCGPRTILFDAVTSSEDREGMLRLCVRSGISTHQRSLETGHYSPMKRALQNGQLPLVRLLHESGSSSNRELYILKNDVSIRTQLLQQRRQDIVQYLDRAASNPASLQHLCRLAVSHLVDCRPGRRDRVTSLPLTWCAKEMVLFEDLK